MAAEYKKHKDLEKKTIVEPEPVIEFPMVEVPQPEKPKVVPQSKSIFEVIIDVILSIFKK